MDKKNIKNLTERIAKFFKKDKGITIPPGGCIGLEFITSWRNDIDEVTIMTNDGPITLDGKNELFIRVSADNANTIKLKVIPDFKKRILTFIEILDPNEKVKDKKAIAFGGMQLVNEKKISPVQQLEYIDKDLEKLGKSVKRFKIYRNLIFITGGMAIVANLYSFLTLPNTDIFKYVYLIFVFIMAYIIYYYWKSYKKISKEYKEFQVREKIFGIVKER